MKKGPRTKSDFTEIPLSIDDHSRLDVVDEQTAAWKELNQEIWGAPARPRGIAYFRPPGRPDLSYEEVGRIEQEHRQKWDKLPQAAEFPKSRMCVQSNAWAWDLVALSDRLDTLTQRLLGKYDLYLCRHVVRLVEAKGERIDWVEVEFGNANAIVYRLWPTEQFETKATLNIKARGGVTAKVGLAQALELVSLNSVGGTEVVWETNWIWVTTTGTRGSRLASNSSSVEDKSV